MKPKKIPGLLSLLILLGLLLLLPLLYSATQTVQQLLTRATGTKAAIIVTATHTLEPIRPFWKSYSQGGEEPKNMIAPIVNETSQLAPRYIRIDHIYDHHPTVSRTTQGGLAFNFTALDGIIRSITQTGALPFISLSYMPQAIAKGDITSVPRNWSEWEYVVQKTVEHISGKDGLNLSDVYYEVWNEPDLFGNWKYSGEKNYLTLYSFAVSGAEKAQNTNSFKIGGPATTQLYKNWITALAEHAINNKVRLDFFSWHRYTTNPTDYAKDVFEVTNWLFKYAALVNTPRVISEWGFDSDVNPGYDGNVAAAHAVATVRQAINGYDQLIAFELVDGPDPGGKKFWGRWGLITHPSKGKTLKPRFSAFQLINEIEGQRLLVQGEGTWVSALASKTDQTVKILLTNYDPAGRNTETVPVTIKPLLNGPYELTTQRLGQSETSASFEVTQGELSTEVIMTPNSVVLLKLSPPQNPFLGN